MIGDIFEATATIGKTRVGASHPHLHLYQPRGVQPGSTGEATGIVSCNRRASDRRNRKEWKQRTDGIITSTTQRINRISIELLKSLNIGSGRDTRIKPKIKRGRPQPLVMVIHELEPNDCVRLGLFLFAVFRPKDEQLPTAKFDQEACHLWKLWEIENVPSAEESLGEEPSRSNCVGKAIVIRAGTLQSEWVPQIGWNVATAEFFLLPFFGWAKARTIPELKNPAPAPSSGHPLKNHLPKATLWTAPGFWNPASLAHPMRLSWVQWPGAPLTTQRGGIPSATEGLSLSKPWTPKLALPPAR